jgi:rRNA maturation endonuclease Nob1
MRCTACGAVWISAAAHQMIAEGERCSNCGGPLELVDPRGDENPGNGEGQERPTDE